MEGVDINIINEINKIISVSRIKKIIPIKKN